MVTLSNSQNRVAIVSMACVPFSCFSVLVKFSSVSCIQRIKNRLVHYHIGDNVGMRVALRNLIGRLYSDAANTGRQNSCWTLIDHLAIMGSLISECSSLVFVVLGFESQP